MQEGSAIGQSYEAKMYQQDKMANTTNVSQHEINTRNIIANQSDEENAIAAQKAQIENQTRDNHEQSSHKAAYSLSLPSLQQILNWLYTLFTNTKPEDKAFIEKLNRELENACELKNQFNEKREALLQKLKATNSDNDDLIKVLKYENPFASAKKLKKFSWKFMTSGKLYKENRE